MFSAFEEGRARALLEMQKNALLMFTSCGWFFSDLAGIETIQIMRYAARLMKLQTRLGFDAPLSRFLEMMSEARSNNAKNGSGADIFQRLISTRSPLDIPVPTVAG